jgi:hypothetical protein
MRPRGCLERKFFGGPISGMAIALSISIKAGFLLFFFEKKNQKTFASPEARR